MEIRAKNKAILRSETLSSFRVADSTNDQFRPNPELTEQAGGSLATQDDLTGLAGVTGYGVLTNQGNSGTATGNKFIASFGTQYGPKVGVDYSNFGWVLGSSGLWVADVTQFFDFYTLGSNKVDMDIRVFNSSGALALQRFNQNENAGGVTMFSSLPFVATSPGWSVRVFVQAALGRGVLAGIERSSLVVRKVSDETS